MTEEGWWSARRPLQTEDEWLSCNLPHRMLRLLQGKASDRKARLFEGACLRRLCHWPEVEERRWAVEVLERHAEGGAAPEEVRSAAAALREAREFTTWVMGGLWNQAFEEMEDHELEALPTAGRTCEAMSIAVGRLARAAAGLEEGRPEEELRAPEQGAQCDLLRCIFGNPFHPVSLAPAWRTPAVLNLAQAAYDDRLLPSGLLDNTGLAILADALEEAGCDNADILSHCRGPGPHVRGCWPVDLLLGKS